MLRLSLLCFFFTLTLGGDCLLGSSKELSSDNKRCPQYNDDSCCSNDFRTTTCTTEDGCSGSPNGCEDWMNMFLCAVSCKPDFVKTHVSGNIITGKLRICTSFYEAMRDACLDYTQCDADDNCFDDSSKCKNVYEDEDDFKKKVIENPLLFNSIEVGDSDDDVECFNSATHLQASLSLVLAVAAAVVA